MESGTLCFIPFPWHTQSQNDLYKEKKKSTWGIRAELCYPVGT